MPKDRTADRGFEPRDPWRDSELGVGKRNLPHLESAGATYFLTFRCAKAVRLTQQARTAVLAALLHWNGSKIFLDAAVVMPDHVHAILRIADGYKLAECLKSIKSFSSREVGKMSGKRGALWLDESFDHIIRHEQEWQEKIEYLRQNPVKWGLAATPAEYRWTYLDQNHRPGGLCHKSN